MYQRPKHTQLHKFLRDKILDGTCPPGSKLPTEVELIEQHRVSSITVIRALNDLAREGLVVRQRRSGTFVADPSEKPLIAGRNLRLGILLSRSILSERLSTDSFQRAVIDGLLTGWGIETPVSVLPVPPTETTRAVWKAPLRGVTVEALGEEDATRRMHPPLNAVRDGGYDGVISLGIVIDSFLRQLQSLGIPCVLVDFLNIRLPVVSDHVYFDPMPGYLDAVNYLVEQGARRIHFIGNLLRTPSESCNQWKSDPDRFKLERGWRDPDSILRLNALQLALNDRNLPMSDRCIHFTWPDSMFVRKVAEDLAALPAHERPDAVVCHSAVTAKVVIEVFAAKGLRLAGAGASELGYIGSALPIFADGKAMGESAASLLIWKLRHPTRLPLRVGIPMHFPSPTGDHPTASQTEPAGESDPIADRSDRQTRNARSVKRARKVER